MEGRQGRVRRTEGEGISRGNTTYIRAGVLTLGGGGGLVVEAAISRPHQLLLLSEVKVQQIQLIPAGRRGVTHAVFKQGCNEDNKMFEIGADTDVDKPHSQDPPKRYVSQKDGVELHTRYGSLFAALCIQPTSFLDSHISSHAV